MQTEQADRIVKDYNEKQAYKKDEQDFLAYLPTQVLWLARIFITF